MRVRLLLKARSFLFLWDFGAILSTIKIDAVLWCLTILLFSAGTTDGFGLCGFDEQWWIDLRLGGSFNLERRFGEGVPPLFPTTLSSFRWFRWLVLVSTVTILSSIWWFRWLVPLSTGSILTELSGIVLGCSCDCCCLVGVGVVAALFFGIPALTSDVEHEMISLESWYVWREYMSVGWNNFH